MAQEEKTKEDKSSKKTKKEEEKTDEVEVTEENTEQNDTEEASVNEEVKDDKEETSSEESTEEGDVAEVEEEELVEENISEEVEGIEEVKEEEKISEFRVGDTIKVSYKIIEGDKVRTQPYQGIVIAMKGSGISKTFTVRKIGADGVGVERIFPLQSPNIEKVALIKRGKVRRAKLYYLRDRVGRKATRIKERIVQSK